MDDFPRVRVRVLQGANIELIPGAFAWFSAGAEITIRAEAARREIERGSVEAITCSQLTNSGERK